jgi:thiamine-monophosphate kinase
VVGRTAQAAMRQGARAGDAIYLVGEVGHAALGLAQLRRQASSGLLGELEANPYVAAFRRPRACIAEGLALGARATAMIDVSDGLVQDLGHLCGASALGANLEATALRPEATFDAAARAIGAAPLELVLGGGEDYALVLTVPADIELNLQSARRIGQMVARAGITLDGAPIACHGGHQHF